MRILAQSLKRLFDKRQITEEKIRDIEILGKITLKEMLYILENK